MYEAPVMEVTHLTSEDILTGSVENEDGWNEDIWNDGKGDNATGDDEL